MPARIAAVLREAGAAVPATRAAFARTIVESIAQAFAGAAAHRRTPHRSRDRRRPHRRRRSAQSPAVPGDRRPRGPPRARRAGRGDGAGQHAGAGTRSRLVRGGCFARDPARAPSSRRSRPSGSSHAHERVHGRIRLGPPARGGRSPAHGGARHRDRGRRRRARRVRRDGPADGPRRRPLPALLDHQAARRAHRGPRDRTGSADPRHAAHRRTAGVRRRPRRHRAPPPPRKPHVRHRRAAARCPGRSACGAARSWS